MAVSTIVRPSLCCPKKGPTRHHNLSGPEALCIIHHLNILHLYIYYIFICVCVLFLHCRRCTDVDIFCLDVPRAVILYLLFDPIYLFCISTPGSYSPSRLRTRCVGLRLTLRPHCSHTTCQGLIRHCCDRGNMQGPTA